MWPTAGSGRVTRRPTSSSPTPSALPSTAVVFPSARSFVKSNLVPPVLATNPGDEHVVYLGRLTESKGLRVLMAAWDRYCETSAPTLRLAIAGTGPLQEEIASWAQTRPSVSVLGSLYRTHAPSWSARPAPSWCPRNGPSLRVRWWPRPWPWRRPGGHCARSLREPHNRQRGRSALPARGPRGPGRHSRAHRACTEWIARLGKEAKVTYERRFEPSANIAELVNIYRFAR